jgi:hypothetical protein
MCVKRNNVPWLPWIQFFKNKNLVFYDKIWHSTPFEVPLTMFWPTHLDIFCMNFTFFFKYLDFHLFTQWVSVNHLHLHGFTCFQMDWHNRLNIYTNVDERFTLFHGVNKFQNFIYTYIEGMFKIIYMPNIGVNHIISSRTKLHI